jgi:hypothetical protein
MARIIPLRRQSPLAFPGVMPGFDPTHPAAGTGGTRYSIVSGPGTGSRNLLNPSGKPTNSTAPTAAIDPVMGPVLVATGSDIRYPSVAIQDSTATVMAICSISSLAAQNDIIGGRQGGFTLGVKTTGALTLFNNNTGDAVSSLILSTGIPYFLAASTNATSVSFVVVNLLTGQTLSATQTGSYTPNINGTLFQYGNGDGGGLPLSGSIACGAYTNAYLTLPNLLQVAQTPWAFWYPNQLDLASMLVAHASGGGGTFIPNNYWQQIGPALAQ